MMSETFRGYGRNVAFALLFSVASTPVAYGQTPLPGGFEIRMQPGYTHVPLRGIDSIVGKIVKKDGLEIQFEMGGVAKEGAPRLGGQYVNQALQLSEKDRAWLKEQIVGTRKINIAYSKDQRLIISTATATMGVNFHVVAKTPDEVADVLLMVLSLAEAKPKLEK